MTAVQVFLTNLRCDDCGRGLLALARSSTEARKKGRGLGWTSGRKIKGNGMFDACDRCRLPDGYREYHR